MTRDESIPPFASEVDEDEPIATTVRRLRREGYSRREAVQFILDVLDLSLSEAKHVLLHHDTWAEVQSESGPEGASPSSPEPPPAPG